MNQNNDTDIIRLLLATCDKLPDNVALRYKNEAVTYRELKTRIMNVATNLRGQGLQENDRVLFSMRPNTDGLMFALGIVAAGGSCVFADLGTPDELFASRIRLAEPKFAATEGILYWMSRYGLKKVAAQKGLNTPDYHSMNVKHFYSGSKLSQLASPRNAQHVSTLFKKPAKDYVEPLQDTEAVIVFTSGTTGEPKSVRHSRSTLGAGVHALISKAGLTPASVVYSTHFMFGIAALIAGSSWVIPEFSAVKESPEFVKGLQDSEASHTFLVPLEVANVINHVEQTKAYLPQLKRVVCGAAPVLPSLIRKVFYVLPKVKILAVYGMTECLPVATVEALDKLFYEEEGDLLGDVCDHLTVDIVDDEIVVSGPGLMLGYLGQKEPTTHHKTGDLGSYDEDGRLVFLGRKKDMLIRGNMNIYPSLYEPAITAIAEVDNCALVGVPDMYGDDVVVLVVAKAGHHTSSETVDITSKEKNLVATLKSRVPTLTGLDSVPDVYVVVTSLPVSPTSHKVDRVKLRESFLPQQENVKRFLDNKYMNKNS